MPALVAGTLLASTIAVSCTQAGAAGGVGTSSIQGWLHTDGQRIVDARGRSIRFFGIQVSMGTGRGLPGADGQHRTGCPGWITPASSDLDRIKGMGFDSVRLGISWANLEPAPPVMRRGVIHHTYNARYLRDLDTVVRGLTARGIVVVLQMAQANWSPAFRNVRDMFGNTMCQGVGMPAWLYPDPGATSQSRAALDFFRNIDGVQDGYAAAWQALAARWSRNRGVVAADMFNEPFRPHGAPGIGALLDDMYDKVGRAIRAVDPHLLLVFQDTRWSTVRRPALPRPPDLPDVVYSFHLYDPTWNPDGQARTEAMAARARTWNVPLWIGEFDAFGYASPGPFDPTWRRDVRAMAAFCDRHGIGINLFGYLPNWVLNAAGTAPKPGLLEAFRQIGTVS
jgi:endoglycosylceramidase